MKVRTLIVDDQLLARELLRRMLKDEPDIEIVGMPASGPEAVEAINSLAPDLVFLDVRMPELDGFGVLAQIDPARMPVIIFVTANDDLRCARSKCMHWITWSNHATLNGFKPRLSVRATKSAETRQGKFIGAGRASRRCESPAAIGGTVAGEIGRPHNFPAPDGY
jgi:chemotaxis response regulator CheB